MTSYADFDASKENQMEEGNPVTSSNANDAPSCQTRSITILFFCFVVLVILLFVVPRYAVNTGDGLMDISQALSYVLLFGLGILGVSIASLVLTVTSWSRISGRSKILGLSPIIGTGIIVLVLALMVVHAANSDNVPVSPAPCYGNETEGCLKPKN